MPQVTYGTLCDFWVCSLVPLNIYSHWQYWQKNSLSEWAARWRCFLSPLAACLQAQVSFVAIHWDVPVPPWFAPSSHPLIPQSCFLLEILTFLSPYHRLSQGHNVPLTLSHCIPQPVHTCTSGGVCVNTIFSCEMTALLCLQSLVRHSHSTRAHCVCDLCWSCLKYPMSHFLFAQQIRLTLLYEIGFPFFTYWLSMLL